MGWSSGVRQAFLPYPNIKKGEKMTTVNTSPSCTPVSLEAEVLLLGSLMVDPSVSEIILSQVSEQDFHSFKHREIFRAICVLYDQGSSLGPALVLEELKRQGSQIGADALFSICEAVSSSACIEDYIPILKDKALGRNLLQISYDIQRKIKNGDRGKNILDSLAEVVYSLSLKEDRKEVLLKDLLTDVSISIDAALERRGIIGIPTQFYELDQHICGLQPGHFTIIAGRPSMGKTCFALNIAKNVAIDAEVTTLFCSLEVPKEQLGQNLVCLVAEVPAINVRRGDIDQEEYTKITSAMSRVMESPLYIHDSSLLGDIKAVVRKLKKRNNLEVVIIDYLQLIQTGQKRRETRQQEISDISQALKDLAQELKVCVIALSQLNRASDAREDHKPRLSDLRESGSLEQNAHEVLLLYRDEYYKPDTDRKGVADIIIAKNRYGPTGTITLYFNSTLGLFGSFLV